ncbi:MAG: insulinase family protein [Erysipelotrichaceae bacterium]|nr:insulinase family protein [Erysipelotrichaceae bacterium]
MNYTLLKQEELTDIHGTASLYRHEQSGALLVTMANADPNKTLAVAFRTPPENDKGIPHILEHSVLCGSDRYPLKDPFVQLLKGSLNTFLNAMTYGQFTVYPVASCNEKDFRTLSNVYLDAVFCPNLLHTPEIFGQEGWHYEEEEDGLHFNGVVFNEMKGEAPSADFILENAVASSLFPHTDRRFVSGGLPEAIVDLTYEEAMDFYRRHYHPSNSVILLYGDMDFTERMEYIDREYLSKYTAQSPIFYETEKDPGERKEVSVSYPLESGSNPQKSEIFALNWVVGSSHDVKQQLALQLADYCLLQSASGTLRRALLEEGIGEEIESSLDTSCSQPVYSILVRKARKDQKERFLEIAEEVLRKTVEEGLDPKLCEASLHESEYLLREEDYGRTPKGLVYSLRLLERLLYHEEDPFAELRMREAFASLKEDPAQALQTLKDCLLENTRSSFVVLSPSESWVAESVERLKKEEQKRVSALSETEKEEALRKAKALRLYRESGDAPEAASCIPLLQREDLNAVEKPSPLKEKEVSGHRALEVTLPTSGIHYVSIFFDLSHLHEKELQTASLLCRILGLMSTKKHDYRALSEEVARKTGGVATVPLFLERPDSQELFRCLQCDLRYLPEEEEDAYALLKEEILETLFDDEKRLKELLEEMRSALQNQIAYRYDAAAAREVTIQFSRSSRLADITTGRSFLRYLNDLSENFPQKKEALIRELQEVSEKIFTDRNVFFQVTADEERLPAVEKAAEAFFEALPKGKEETPYNVPLKEKTAPEGLYMASQVQYCALAAKGKTLSMREYAHRMVLSQILNTDHLWQEIRVLGGAYGCGAGFERDGSVILTSFRDPQISNTLRVFRELPEYVKNFEADEEEMRRFVIGTMNRFDSPLSSYREGVLYLTRWLRGNSREDIEELRKAVISTTAEDIRALAPGLEEAFRDVRICVLGNEEKLKACAELQQTSAYF